MVQKLLESSWERTNLLTLVLLPLSILYYLALRTHKLLYRLPVKRAWSSPIPVVVIGNLTVGGTGKTPTVIAIANYLQAQGYTPGIISRGYKGAQKSSLLLDQQTPVDVSGDEAQLLLRQTNAPLAIGAHRKRSIKALLDKYDVNVVISDDGLQHWALAGDIEICISDTRSRFNNRFLLPAGPFREPASRLRKVDFHLKHGQEDDADHEYALNLQAGLPRRVSDDAEIVIDLGQRIHAIAGIGQPQRFFNLCRALGWQPTEHVFADHHYFAANDVCFDDDLMVLMTEKDAVKCQSFAHDKLAYLPVSAQLSDDFYRHLLAKLKQCSE